MYRNEVESIYSGFAKTSARICHYQLKKRIIEKEDLFVDHAFDTFRWRLTKLFFKCLSEFICILIANCQGNFEYFQI